MKAVSRAARGLAMAAALAVAGFGVAIATPANAAGQFQCMYRFFTYQGGFLADLMIFNTGPAVTNWAAHWTFDHDERLNAVWSAVLVQQNREINAAPVDWNRTIMTNGVASFGWTAFAATTSTPDDITVNGQPCPPLGGGA